MHNCLDKTVTGVHHKVQAQKAWHQWSWCYDEINHPHHFAKGFKAGYRDVLDGGKGCQPTLPPRCYWKSCYRSAEGRCKVNAWFDGFSHGAMAAQQDGAGNWNQIPISPTARMNLQMASAQPKAFGIATYGVPMPIAGSVPPPAPAALPLITTDEDAAMELDMHEAEWNTDSEERMRLPYE